jgi:type I restriction enzyme, R subunit
MPNSSSSYITQLPSSSSGLLREDGIEAGFIGKLQGLKHEYRLGVGDRALYLANNNARHFAFHAKERFLPVYEFADEPNRKNTHLDGFTTTFLKKCVRGRTISRYMVLLAGEQKLMSMRPYQVYAVRHMVKCIDDDDGKGVVWHTTGSGKTLTSCKASTLLKENDSIHKCVFVVDRKDLDRQTREEFNKFQEGCVEENTNTAALVVS